MAETAKKDNKNLIFGICAAVLVVVVIVVAAIFATRGSSPKLSDDYFVSDDTKYVLTVDGDEAYEEDEEFAPVKTHVVYNYSGDTITGVTTYMEYTDEATAKTVYDVYKNEEQDGVKSVSLNGKYLVVEMTEDQYADITASDVKQQIEFMEMLKNIDSSDLTDAEESEEE